MDRSLYEVDRPLITLINFTKIFNNTSLILGNTVDFTRPRNDMNIEHTCIIMIKYYYIIYNEVQLLPILAHTLISRSLAQMT